MKKPAVLLLVVSLLLVSCKQEVYYNVTTAVQPAEGGAIVVTPSSESVLDGTAITIQAIPNGDYSFTGWGGSLSGTENPTTIVVTTDLNLFANFSLRSYALTITTEGEGSVTEKVVSTKTDYDSGTVVELTAIPSAHWIFDHWEGDLSGNENPVCLTMTSEKMVKAVFLPKNYDLTIKIQGEGAVKERIIETKTSYQEGTVVELTANPSEKWAFDHWEGLADTQTSPVVITINEAIEILAVFVKHDPELDKIIAFQDQEVKKIVIQNFDSNHDGELSYGEALLLVNAPNCAR